MSFDHALGFVLTEEGGYSDHPADPGGATLNGITQRAYDAYRHARQLPPQTVKDASESEISAIYGEYWEAAKCNEWSGPVAFVVFDTAVQRGPGRAIRDLQEAAGVKADGLVGPKTRAAVSAQLDDILVERLLLLRSDHYVARCKAEPSQMVFLMGWMRRLTRLSIAAGKML